MKVTVISGTGLIGASLVSGFDKGQRPVRYSTRKMTSPGDDASFPLDLSQIGASGQLPEQLGFSEGETVYICAAMTKFDDCMRDPAASHDVNVKAPLIIAKRATDAGARVVFLSSIAVFCCLTPNIPIDGIKDGKSVYGSQKSEAEDSLLGLDRDIAVVRLTKVLPHQAPLLKGWQDALSRGEPITPFCDMWMAPVALPAVTQFLSTFADQFEGGLFQLSGSKDIRYDDAAIHIAESMGVSRDLVQPKRGEHHGISPEQRNRFSSMAVGEREHRRGFLSSPPDRVIDWALGNDQTKERDEERV